MNQIRGKVLLTAGPIPLMTLKLETIGSGSIKSIWPKWLKLCLKTFKKNSNHDSTDENNLLSQFLRNSSNKQNKYNEANIKYQFFFQTFSSLILLGYRHSFLTHTEPSMPVLKTRSIAYWYCFALRHFSGFLFCWTASLVEAVAAILSKTVSTNSVGLSCTFVGRPWSFVRSTLSKCHLCKTVIQGHHQNQFFSFQLRKFQYHRFSLKFTHNFIHTVRSQACKFHQSFGRQFKCFIQCLLWFPRSFPSVKKLYHWSVLLAFRLRFFGSVCNCSICFSRAPKICTTVQSIRLLLRSVHRKIIPIWSSFTWFTLSFVQFDPKVLLSCSKNYRFPTCVHDSFQLQFGCLIKSWTLMIFETTLNGSASSWIFAFF